MSSNGDRRRFIVEEFEAWAGMIVVVLDRLVAAIKKQTMEEPQRLELSIGARKIDNLFASMEDIVEIQDESDILFEEFTRQIDRLREVISDMHAILDRLLESDQ